MLPFMSRNAGTVLYGRARRSGRDRIGGSFWPRCAGVVVAAAVSWAPIALAGQDRSAEYQLKAAFVAKFPLFAEWPSEALEGRKTIDLCVARPNPFGTALAELVADETLQDRPLTIREVPAARAIDGCHVLFVPALTAGARKEFLNRAASLPTLTIGDYPEFLGEGGIVLLQMAGGRVRFEINAAAASRVGLRLSSQLFRLAVAVHGAPP